MVKDTILQLCKENDIAISALEKKLGFSNYTIMRWDKFIPKLDNVQKVAEYFDVSLDYLVTGDSSLRHISPQKTDTNCIKPTENGDFQALLGQLQSIVNEYGTPMPTENRKIPIVGTVKCGPNGIAYEDIDAYLLVDESLHGDLFALRTKGDSMCDKGIDEGDLAIIRQQDDVESGEIAAVLIDDEEATLKRVVKLPNGIALEAANSKYPTRYFMENDMKSIKVLGKLLEIRKRF